jgi:hypothetical protein
MKRVVAAVAGAVLAVGLTSGVGFAAKKNTGSPACRNATRQVQHIAEHYNAVVAKNGNDRQAQAILRQLIKASQRASERCQP